MRTIDKHFSKLQLIQHRLRVLADADQYGVAKTARKFRVFPSTIYRWKQTVEPAKRGPRGRVDWQTDTETESFILQVKLATSYGPKRLRAELVQFGVVVGEKAIRGVLECANLVEHHSRARVKKKEKFYAPFAGYRLQADTKGVPNGGDKRKAERHQFTAIDIVTKIRFLRMYDCLSNHNSIEFVRHALEFYRIVDVVRLDHTELQQAMQHYLDVLHTGA